MKRLLLLSTFFLLAATSTIAQKKEPVTLDDEHSTQQVVFAGCKIFVTKLDAKEGDSSRVRVELENLNESYYVILFGRAYSVKSLKKSIPSVRFDENFPGGNRDLDTIRNADWVKQFVAPSEKHILLDLQIPDAEKTVCHLPLYIAKDITKKTTIKLLLIEKRTLDLEIEVAVKPDEDYVRLEGEYKALIEEVNKQTFCKHPQHKPSLEIQEFDYKERIKKVVIKLDSVVYEHNWSSDDKRRIKYEKLKEKTRQIEFQEVSDCGKTELHKHRSHDCRYCKLSAEQICQKIEDYYIGIYRSSNRQKAKDKVKADVELLYKCPSWKRSNYKSKITDYYNKIKKF